MPSRLASRVPALAFALAACASLPFGAARREYWAFTAPWDARSAASARAHAAALNAVVYGWFSLDTVTAMPVTLYADTLSRLAPTSTRRMAIVTNGIGGSFHPDVVRRLAADESARGRAAAQLVRRAAEAGYRGLVIDLEGLSAADRAGTALVARAFADSARAHRLGIIAVAVPALDTAGYPAALFLPNADFVLVMLYDQHWATSPPGPIATPEWTRTALGLRVAEVGADHIVAALPTYGYQWPASGPASPVSYEEARRLAAASGRELARDAPSVTLHAENAGQWSVWVSDAELLRALLEQTDALGVRRIAFWRLGLEDPRLWELVRR